MSGRGHRLGLKHRTTVEDTPPSTSGAGSSSTPAASAENVYEDIGISQLKQMIEKQAKKAPKGYPSPELKAMEDALEKKEDMRDTLWGEFYKSVATLGVFGSDPVGVYEALHALLITPQNKVLSRDAMRTYFY